MKIGIIGSRKRVTGDDQKKMIHAFDDVESKLVIQIDSDAEVPRKLYGGVHLVSGGYQNGADLWAEQLAKVRGLPITIYNAAWQTFGKAAGPIRNEFIARDSDVLIALTHSESKGTTNCINQFTKFHPDGKVIMI